MTNLNTIDLRKVLYALGRAEVVLRDNARALPTHLALIEAIAVLTAAADGIVAPNAQEA